MYRAVGFCLLLLARVSAAQRVLQPPVLIAFAISDSAVTAAAGQPLQLSHRSVGARPTHYRVSQRADFSGAPWLSYEPQLLWQGAPAAGSPCSGRQGGMRLRLYLQVRVVLGQEVRIVDGQRTLVPMAADSNVLTDDICIAS